MPDGQGRQIIQVRVKLFGHLKQIAQEGSFELETPADSTVYEVIQAMARQMGDDFQKALLEPGGNLHGGIEVILNHEHLPARRINQIYILENCDLFIMPMIEGGAQSTKPCNHQPGTERSL